MKLHEHLSPQWQSILSDELATESFRQLNTFVTEEQASHINKIYPPGAEVFSALNLVPFDQVKVVILGQDPYHGPGQAHGLSFSVAPGIPHPPSLKNIFKELNADVGCSTPEDGTLTPWAKQGVLLLNTVLTVRHKEANSHRKKGWEQFTDAIIAKLGLRESQIVFILWGNPARKKSKLIDSDRHAIIESAHPSPLSAHNGFWGSRPFSRANEALKTFGHAPIDWQLE